MIMATQDLMQISKKILVCFFAVGVFLSANAHAQAQQTQSSGDGTYDNADISISSLWDYLQYPVPASGHMKELPDHSISFEGTTKGSNGAAVAVDDEWRFEAAWRFCEHFRPRWPPPPFNPTAPEDLAAYEENRSYRAMMSVGMDECIQALSERTGCPAASKSSFKMVGQSEDCYTQQKAACDKLKNPDPEKGYGIVSIGDPEADFALKNCDTYGLSVAMYNKINAYRCNDMAYIGNVLPRIFGGDTAAVEHAVQFECPGIQQSYELKMSQAKSRLQNAIYALIELRKMSPKPSDRQAVPVGAGNK